MLVFVKLFYYKTKKVLQKHFLQNKIFLLLQPNWVLKRLKGNLVKVENYPRSCEFQMCLITVPLSLKKMGRRLNRNKSEDLPNSQLFVAFGRKAIEFLFHIDVLFLPLVTIYSFINQLKKLKNEW